MDSRNEVRDFLASRRARITPRQAGLPAYGGNRRVPGRDPYDKDLTDLIGELCTRSDDFRTRWARHNVRRHHAGTKRYHHPAVGDLVLDYESIDLVADGGLNLTAYTANPDSSSHDALRLLASWAATLDDAASSDAGYNDAGAPDDAARADGRPRRETGRSRGPRT